MEELEVFTEKPNPEEFDLIDVTCCSDRAVTCLVKNKQTGAIVGKYVQKSKENIFAGWGVEFLEKCGEMP